MSFDDISVKLRVQADTAELKAAIKDFDGSAEAVERLKNATNDLKSSTNDLNQGQRALTISSRVQTFELRNSLRFLRAGISLFRGLNQVMSLVLLSQIKSNTELLKQQEGFDALQKALPNLAKVLQLSPEDPDAINSMKDFLDSAKDLNSDQITKIAKAARLLFGTSPTAAQQEFLNSLEKLGEAKKGDEIKKQMESISTTILTIGQTAVEIGTFIAMLKLARGSKFPGLEKLTTLFATIGGASAGLSALAVAAPFIAELLIPGKIDLIQKNLEDFLSGKVPERPQGFSLFPQFPQAGGETGFQSRFVGSSRLADLQSVTVNINSLTLSNGMDIDQFVNLLVRKINEKKRSGAQ